MAIDTPEDERLREFSLGWYGYGRWEAPYWFVGLEPGGDELAACVKAWYQLKQAPLLDVQDGHEFHAVDFFSEYSSEPQKTWEKLIWLMLAFDGKDPTRAATLAYRKAHLARGDPTKSNMALLELSAIPTKTNDPDLWDKEIVGKRVDHIRDMVRQKHPAFIVMYGFGKKDAALPWWRNIAGIDLSVETVVRVGETLMCILKHPNGAWDKRYWIGYGRELRERLVQR